MNKSPFIIELDADQNQVIRAKLINRSNSDQLFLSVGFLQRSELVLISASGRCVTAFDTRSIKKYDNTVYKHSFQMLNFGESVPFGESKFKKDARGNYSLRWGPFEFNDVTPGVYNVQVLWESRMDSWYSSEENRLIRINGVWLGSLYSNEVNINLPK